MSVRVPVHLSPSRVGSFTSCGQAFRFKAIDRLPEPDTEAAALGNVVHDALYRFYYQGYDYDHSWMPLHDALLAAGLFDPVARQEVRDLCGNLWKVEDPARVRVAGCELRLECELAGHPMVGIIDRLDVEDDGLVVVDYKTGKVPQPRQERDKLMGVMHYALMAEKILGVRPVRVKLIYLQKPMVLTAEPTDQIMRGLEMRLAAMWNAIESACERDAFRPKVSPLCSWCSFQALCPAWEA